MLLDSDKDILKNSYGKWFERMSWSFEKQIRKQLTLYNSTRCEMIIDDILQSHLPFIACLQYIRKDDVNPLISDVSKWDVNRETGTTINVMLLRPDEMYIKSTVEEAMNFLVNSAGFEWTEIEPLESE